ncbi:uncharacterized protein LOC142329308 [Lycorma delicatula]|uniref:uncharacterized protein LOC142329308 n=1 Tax=Lycorma delicatula TaxID=130591 RepID=UPI003F50D6AD
MGETSINNIKQFTILKGGTRNFTLVWLPDDIKFIINGEEKSIISSNGNKKLSSAVELNDLCDKLWDSESKIAPFDQAQVGLVRLKEEPLDQNVRLDDLLWLNLIPCGI